MACITDGWQEQLLQCDEKRFKPWSKAGSLEKMQVQLKDSQTIVSVLLVWMSQDGLKSVKKDWESTVNTPVPVIQ